MTEALWNEVEDSEGNHYLGFLPEFALEVRFIDGEWLWRGWDDENDRRGEGWGVDKQAAMNAAERWTGWLDAPHEPTS